MNQMVEELDHGWSLVQFGERKSCTNDIKGPALLDSVVRNVDVAERRF